MSNQQNLDLQFVQPYKISKNYYLLSGFSDNKQNPY